MKPDIDVTFDGAFEYTDASYSKNKSTFLNRKQVLNVFESIEVVIRSITTNSRNRLCPRTNNDYISDGSSLQDWRQLLAERLSSGECFTSIVGNREERNQHQRWLLMEWGAVPNNSPQTHMCHRCGKMVYLSATYSDCCDLCLKEMEIASIKKRF